MFDRLDRKVRGAMAGDEDDGDARIKATQSFEGLEPGCVRQVHVEYDSVGSDCVGQVEALGGRGCRVQRQFRIAERPLKSVADGRLVVDYQQGWHRQCQWSVVSKAAAVRGGGSETEALSGSNTAKRAPPSGRLAAVIRPPCSSTMRRDVTSPSPRPVGLVLTNGSKSRDITRGAIPGPVSRMASSTRLGPSGYRSTASVPPPGIASSEFSARLTSTCLICSPSASSVTGRLGGSNRRTTPCLAAR